MLIVRDVTRDGEIDRLKHDFLAKVSHELRTPLTAILGFTQVLTRRWSSLADERRGDYVAVLDRQANRLWRLISGVLIASEIERGEPNEPRGACFRLVLPVGREEAPPWHP